TCGITTTDTAKCWGEDVSGSLAPPAGAFVQVTVGYRFACGLRATGLVECWGSTPGNLGVIPADTFRHIEAGMETVCGIKTDFSIKCWGSDAQGVIGNAPSSGVFDRITSGWQHVCALKQSDDTMLCWGYNLSGQGVAHTGDASHRWVFVSAGTGHNCGLTMEGNFYCWGSDTSGQSTIPATFPGF
ncbi:MAG: hypothetical protein ABIJ09_25920, partial [Pseudomonadota bacterium]